MCWSATIERSASAASAYSPATIRGDTWGARPEPEVIPAERAMAALLAGEAAVEAVEAAATTAEASETIEAAATFSAWVSCEAVSELFGFSLFCHQSAAVFLRIKIWPL